MIKVLLALVLASACAAAPGGADAGDVQTAAPASSPRPAPTPTAEAVEGVGVERLIGDVRALADDRMEGREAGTPGGARARAYLLERLKETGARPLFGDSFEQPFDFKTRGGEARRGTNLVAHVRGRARPERLIVVTAHYDHLGVRDGVVYNGADDNASGTAVLLALAEHFARRPPRHTVVFAALDAEEQRLQGAEALVKRLTAEKRELALNVNMDMVSHSEKGELYAAGAHHTPALAPLLERLAKTAPVKLLLGHDRPEQGQDDWTSQSDHFHFHRAGVPFVYFGVEDHKDYHKPTDDFETITPDFFARAAATILAALKSFDENLDSVGKGRPAAPPR
ncbi:MAG TPA: M20/M25/M40 family metallo-hydrolase [Pyrinomonadaceae bacterium]|nr:M20/M25/M40 family metallo-hydrolase [Pyrinomonadaceae bacterium]